MTLRIAGSAPLVVAGLTAGGVVLLAAVFAAPAAMANSCHSRCDSNYYLCNRGGASPGERWCATGRSTCYTRCRGSAGPSYGAIAYSGTAAVHGFSRNQGSRARAEAEALGHCRARERDAGDCKVLVWFYDRCAALATGSKGAHGSARKPRSGEPRSNKRLRIADPSAARVARSCARSARRADLSAELPASRRTSQRERLETGAHTDRRRRLG
jgi:hypothetical protein